MTEPLIWVMHDLVNVEWVNQREDGWWHMGVLPPALGMEFGGRCLGGAGPVAWAMLRGRALDRYVACLGGLE